MDVPQSGASCGAWRTIVGQRWENCGELWRDVTDSHPNSRAAFDSAQRCAAAESRADGHHLTYWAELRPNLSLRLRPTLRVKRECFAKIQPLLSDFCQH